MLISSVNLLPDEIGIFLRLAVLCALSAVVAVVVHGWFQALVATAFGDPAPRAQGRLLGNPLRHVDPAGAILAAVSGFGWGRPMPGRPDRHGRWPSVAIAAAGPVGNLTVAFLLAAPIKAGLLVVYNLMLAAFQILPLAPLAGYRALVALLPESADETHQKFQRFAPLLLVVLIASDYVLRPGILWSTVLQIAQWLGGLATGY